jgi:hypothetical protein
VKCYSPAQVGYWASGASAFGWTDQASYNSAGIWNNLAMKFELYDLDICYGHAAVAIYHRKCSSIRYLRSYNMR